MTSVRPAGIPGAYGSAKQIDAEFENGYTSDAPTADGYRSSLAVEPHPVWGTLAAEKFTEGMVPAMSSVYPGKNMPAGVAGDFDKIYLPRPLVRKVHPGRPLMKGETAKKKIDDVPESFHDTISSAPPFDYDDDKPYTVPPYAPDFPLESNMDPQRMHAGYMAAPDIPTATLPAKPKSPWPRDGEEPAEFPADADLRKLSAGSLSDAPFHSTFTSEDMEMSKKETHLTKSHAAGAKQGKNFSDHFW